MIEANLHLSPRASEIAKQANLSHFRFLHIFKEEMGESFGRYCNRLRMERALHLLQSSNQGLEVIAAKVGLPSSKALAYHFRKRFRFPPSRFRNKAASACDGPS